MATMIEKTGKSVEDALQAALDELKVSAENVEVEVLETPSKGFFGFGAKPARVQVTLKNVPATETVPASEPIAEEKISDAEPIAEEKFSDAESVAEKISAPETAENISEETAAETIADVANKEKVAAEETVAETAVAVFDKAEIIAAAKKFLAEVFAEMKIEVEIRAEETGSTVLFDLSGKNLGVLIGKHGQTLDALQYLTNLAANRLDVEGRVHFVLDVENYRARREETLQKLAKSVADRAVRMRQEVRLEPMNRHERRIIHTALQNNDRIETRSVGEEPYRYIIVAPKRRGR